MSTFSTYFYKNIAIRLRSIRKLKGYTQEELSELIDKNPKYIGHIERCERQMSNRVLIKILDVLQIQPSEFFNFDKKYKW